MVSGLQNPVHLLIVLFVILLLIGTKRLSGRGWSLRSGLRRFRDRATAEKQGVGSHHLMSEVAGLLRVIGSSFAGFGVLQQPYMRGGANSLPRSRQDWSSWLSLAVA